VEQLAGENRRLAAAAGALAAAGYPPEIRAILERGFVTFAMTRSDQKPFFYADPETGDLVGLDVELAYAAANRLGVRAVFNRDAENFNGVVDKIVRGEADIALSKLSRTEDRAARVRFTKPYIVFRRALLFNRLELARVSSEAEIPYFVRRLTGRIGVIKNSSYETYAAENFPQATVTPFDTWGETVDALFRGEILAVYRDEQEVLIVTTTRKDASILAKAVVIRDEQDPICAAVAAGAPLLQAWLDIFLEDYLFHNGDGLTVRALVERHFAGAEP